MDGCSKWSSADNEHWKIIPGLWKTVFLGQWSYKTVKKTGKALRNWGAPPTKYAVSWCLHYPFPTENKELEAKTQRIGIMKPNSWYQYIFPFSGNPNIFISMPTLRKMNWRWGDYLFSCTHRDRRAAQIPFYNLPLLNLIAKPINLEQLPVYILSNCQQTQESSAEPPSQL